MTHPSDPRQVPAETLGQSALNDLYQLHKEHRTMAKKKSNKEMVPGEGWKDLNPVPEGVFAELACIYGRLRGTHSDNLKAAYAGSVVLSYAVAQLPAGALGGGGTSGGEDAEQEEIPEEAAGQRHGDLDYGDPDKIPPAGSADTGGSTSQPDTLPDTLRLTQTTNGEHAEFADRLEEFFPQLAEEGKPTKTKGKEAMKQFAANAPGGSQSIGWETILTLVGPLVLEWLRNRPRRVGAG